MVVDRAAGAGDCGLESVPEFGFDPDMETIDSLHGQEVVLTGDFRRLLGWTRKELQREMRQRGATVKDDVTLNTTILARGESPLWKYGRYGEREDEVAEMQRRGYDVRIIDATGLWSLLHGKPAKVLQPHEATTPQAVSRSTSAEVKTAVPTDRLCGSCYLHKPLGLFEGDGETCSDCA